MAILRLAHVHARLVPTHRAPEVEDVVRLHNLVVEAPYVGGLGVGLGAAQHPFWRVMFEDAHHLLGDKEAVGRVLHAEVRSAMDAGPDAVGAAAAGVVGVVLVAVEAALRPARQVPAQHRPHRFKVVLRVVGRHLRRRRETG